MRKHLFVAIVLAYAGSAAAQSASSYFPLNQGDKATFVGDNNVTREFAVNAAINDWRQVSDLMGAGPTGLSVGLNGQISLRATPSSPSRVFIDFSRSVNTTFNAQLGPCTKSATIVAKNQQLTVPAGRFSNVVQVDFARNCADGGLLSAWFAPGAGLVKWAETSIAGPRQYSLQSARIGETYFGTPAIRVSAELPGPKVLVNVTPKITARLKIENLSNQDQTFECPSTQQFDIVINDAQGQFVTSWAAKRMFPQVITQFVVPAGGTHTVGGDVELKTLDTNLPLDIGSYTVEALLRCHIRQEASAFAPVPSYSAKGPLFIDQRVSIGF
ncbi:BsuPI-related putative proteinase inhibitor [Tahibacter amnicola]|uniref:Intracellular proteinase inhibitor BsuPI domain-containing protein n=1 Tax=Tahibacter amnicola TaxID=2976241 RepID=A0ABY6BJE7_9GAMM|nr:BsuPI-related putative proteinase inhibitor [Tahibacter amnicola]UXI69592.1 BsuPI-related putative proteinase inhibitor [Tahibacter amnicola]